jgi:hypothetical protein
MSQNFIFQFVRNLKINNKEINKGERNKTSEEEQMTSGKASGEKQKERNTPSGSREHLHV